MRCWQLGCSLQTEYTCSSFAIYMQNPSKKYDYILLAHIRVYILKYGPIKYGHILRAHIWVYSRLLHPQYLDEILTGLTQYRLPFDTLGEYPEPWSWKISGSERERTCKFQCSEKYSSRHGGGGLWFLEIHPSKRLHLKMSAELATL